jgi:galactoside O-acetyltransferase
MAFYDRLSLEALGFAHLGKDVLISDRASIYGAARISIGDRTRIDDFCVLSAGEAGFEIGSNVHIACYVSVIGAGRVVMEDFVGVSARTCVYSSNDDYTGEHMSNPTVPDAFKFVTNKSVVLRKHALIGAGCVVLPGVELGEGAVVGAMSLVTRDCEPWWIYTGVPAKKAKERSRRLLELEPEYLRSLEGPGG